MSGTVRCRVAILGMFALVVVGGACGRPIPAVNAVASPAASAPAPAIAA